jgi:hypothetical protein
MAKKKKSTTRRTGWQARPDDAIRLAALRWFALEIERVAIEIYATDPAQFEPMENLLRKTMRGMAGIAGQLHARLDDECPVGYVLCKDRTCAPMCDGIVGNQNES